MMQKWKIHIPYRSCMETLRLDVINGNFSLRDSDLNMELTNLHSILDIRDPM